MKGKIDTVVSKGGEGGKEGGRGGGRKKRRGREKGGRILLTGRFAVLISVLGVHEL